MTALYRVWQPQIGERARDVEPIAALDRYDAVEDVHGGDRDGPDVQVYCVQRVHIAGDAVYRGEKVRVVRSVRRIVQKFEIGLPLASDELQARCRTCGRMFFQLDERVHPSGVCRRCGNR